MDVVIDIESLTIDGSGPLSADAVARALRGRLGDQLDPVALDAVGRAVAAAVPDEVADGHHDVTGSSSWRDGS